MSGDLPQQGGLTLSLGFGFYIPAAGHAFLPSVAYVLSLGFRTQRKLYEDAGFIGPKETTTVAGNGVLLDLPFAAALAPHISLLIGPRLTFLSMPAQPYTYPSTPSTSLTVGVAAGMLGYF